MAAMRVPMMLVACAVSLLVAGNAEAFCGFYVSGGDAKLFNNATLVSLMREGTRTAIAMQNNYQGPTEDFAMVVPVPVVLSEDNVKTLPRDVFDRLDQLSAPRLVEYWEQDPCAVGITPDDDMPLPVAPAAMAEEEGGRDVDYEVTIEAKFAVGEYQILILSAGDSSGLERWLVDHDYKIPPNSEPLLRPYVEQGTKFFVAKVDIEKVAFNDKGQAMLSPLRIHYDSQDLRLPIRLGLINAGEAQDLIVFVLARGQRYEVANYDNVTIPTNLNVTNGVRDQFGAFYAALFDRVLALHPRAVVTEYAWDASSCDPCPEPPLQGEELMTLGADAMPSQEAYGFVLTRLHARYSRDTVGDDLVFRTAPAIVGGREVYAGGGSESGDVERGAKVASGGYNNFQGRYIIRHAWEGAIDCENPRRGVWGGPPSGGDKKMTVARDLAFAPRGSFNLASAVSDRSDESWKVLVQKGSATPPTPTPLPPPPRRGCGCEVAGETTTALDLLGYCFALSLLGAFAMRRRGSEPKPQFDEE